MFNVKVRGLHNIMCPCAMCRCACVVLRCGEDFMFQCVEVSCVCAKAAKAVNAARPRCPRCRTLA